MHDLRITPHTGRIVLAALLALGVTVTSAQASTIPFTSAFTGTVIPGSSTQTIVSNPTSASQTPSGSWGSATATASVDVAAGQMGGQAAVTYVNAVPYVYSQFQAAVGDGFRTYDENMSPFSWNGQTTEFSFDIDGTFFAPAYVSNVVTYVALILYEPGSVQPGMNYFDADGKFAQYVYFLGHPNQNTYYGDRDGNLIQLFPTAYLGDPGNGLHISQTITPDGDFDWVVLMQTSVYLTEPGTLDVDLSHTVTMNYTGPAGATTQSVSGQFNNIANPAGAPVPEPGVMTLLGLAACACVARRRVPRHVQ